MRTLNLAQWKVLTPVSNDVKVMPRKNVIRTRSRAVKQESEVMPRRKIMLRRYDMGRSEISSWSPLLLSQIDLRGIDCDSMLLSYQKRFVAV